MKLGTISTFTSDKKVYPQDLAGVSRDNFTDAKLIGLTRLLQSLDDDGDIGTAINIPASRAAAFGEGANDANLSQLAKMAGVTLVGSETAMAHLRGNAGSSGSGDDSSDEGGDNPISDGVLVFNDAFIENRANIKDNYYILECETQLGDRDQDIASYNGHSSHELGNVEYIKDSMVSLDNGKIVVKPKGATFIYEVVKAYDDYSVVKVTITVGGHTGTKWEYWYKDYQSDESLSQDHAVWHVSDLMQIRLNGTLTHDGECSMTSWQNGGLNTLQLAENEDAPYRGESPYQFK